MADKWQKDWLSFLSFLTERVRAGDDKKTLDRHFAGETIAWEGSISEIVDKPPRAMVTLDMTPANLDFGSERSSSLDYVVLTPAADSIESWKALDIGSPVRFSAILGSKLSVFPAVEVSFYESGKTGVFISLIEARPL